MAAEKKEKKVKKPILDIQTPEVWQVKVKFTEPTLGSTPKDPEVYASFIESKKPVEQQDPESQTVEAAEERGWTGFRRDEVTKQLFTYDYTWRGFLKEQADCLRQMEQLNVWDVKGKIDRMVFVRPRRVFYLDAAGAPVSGELTVLERPLRAETRQGPRVTLTRSDVLPVGTQCEFEVHVHNPKLFSEEVLRAIFDRGGLMGFSQWRTGGYGTFSYEMKLKK